MSQGVEKELFVILQSHFLLCPVPGMTGLILVYGKWVNLINGPPRLQDHLYPLGDRYAPRFISLVDPY
jgi:hypothetical protein